jgi:DNA-binding GntR family transcriptional regulator
MLLIPNPSQLFPQHILNLTKTFENDRDNTHFIINNFVNKIFGRFMAEMIIKRLEMAILTGELKPRERLVESELISKFNVKRFAARKAIQELAYRGLVEVIPNKGARVVDISDKEVEDIYRVRMNLELLAAELTVERLTREKLTHLKKVQKNYAAAVESGVFEEMVSKNEAFHRTFYQMSENRFLAEHLEKLTNAIFTLRYNAYFLLGIAQRTIEDHEAVIQALEERDIEKLKRITKDSIIYPKMIYLSRKMSPLRATKTLKEGEAQEEKEKEEKKRQKTRIPRRKKRLNGLER